VADRFARFVPHRLRPPAGKRGFAICQGCWRAAFWLLLLWVLTRAATAECAGVLQLRLPGRGGGVLRRPAVGAGAGLAGCRRNAAEEREKLSLAVGWLLGWAGQQTPICRRSWRQLRRRRCLWTDGLHRPLDHRHAPVAYARSAWLAAVSTVSWSRCACSLSVRGPLFGADRGCAVAAANDAPERRSRPERYVVDSWFRDNGQPAVVMALPELARWRRREERRGCRNGCRRGRGDGLPNEH
jgi:hypothetical protein